VKGYIFLDGRTSRAGWPYLRGRRSSIADVLSKLINVRFDSLEREERESVSRGMLPLHPKNAPGVRFFKAKKTTPAARLPRPPHRSWGPRKEERLWTTRKGREKGKNLHYSRFATLDNSQAGSAGALAGTEEKKKNSAHAFGRIMVFWRRIRGIAIILARRIPELADTLVPEKKASRVSPDAPRGGLCWGWKYTWVRRSERRNQRARADWRLKACD